MASGHLKASMIQRVAAGEQPSGELVVDALRHLSAGDLPACPTCKKLLRPYPLGRIAERSGGVYTELLARAAGRGGEIEAEHRAAHALIEELAAERNLARAVGLVAASPRFATAGMGLALIDLAAAQIPEDAELGCHLALLAAVVAERLDRHRYRGPLPDDLQASAHATRADALRAAGDLEEAAQELERAEECLRRGSGFPIIKAEVDLIRCRLRLAEGRLDAVQEECERVERWASRAGQVDQAWEASRISGELNRLAGRPADAAEELRVLAGAMRGEASAATELSVRSLLVACLLEAESYNEAWAELGTIAVVLEDEARPRMQARLGFLRGRALRGLGRTEEAAEALETAKQALAEEGLGLEALQASFHLLDLLREACREADLAQRLAALPDLLTVRGLPPWGAAYLVSVCEEGWGRPSDRLWLESARESFDELVLLGMPEGGKSIQ